MQEELNLRDYVSVVIRYWYWIAGLALVAAVAAFVITSLQPIAYEATAVVVVTQPPYLFQFNQQSQVVPFDPIELSKAYPTIATSDEILLAVANGADTPLSPERQGIETLRKMFKVETDGTSNLILLTVRASDAQEAAALVNAWAEELVTYLNDLYGRSNDMPLFQAQMAKSQAALEQIDQALVALRRDYGLGFSDSTDQGTGPAESNPIGLVRRLEAKTDLLMQYETEADQITRLLAEAQAINTQISDTTSPAILSGLLLDMARLGIEDVEAAPLVQINLSGLNTDDSVAALITALEAKQASLSETIVQLTDEVQTLQAELAEKQGELDRLLRERQVTQSTFLTLSDILEEADIEAQDQDVQLLSRAAVPQRPASRGRLRNTLVAGALGVMIGVFGAFAVEYWRQAPSIASVGG